MPAAVVVLCFDFSFGFCYDFFMYLMHCMRIFVLGKIMALVNAFNVDPSKY